MTSPTKSSYFELAISFGEKMEREMTIKKPVDLELLREFYVNEVFLTTVFIYLHDVRLCFFQMAVQPPKDE